MMKFSAEKSQKIIINNELVDITIQVVFDPFIHQSKQIGNFTFKLFIAIKYQTSSLLFTDFPIFFYTIFTVCN